MFLQNYWYAAAWDYEIKGKPFARTICGSALVFYRKDDNTLVALDDCCWHRLLPLSKGFLRVNNIVCGYHGLEYDAGGQCVHMPSEKGIHPNAKVRSYPVLERHRIVWVWVGDSALAHENKIPDFRECSSPEWVFEGSIYNVKCDYQLLVDNLMDLSHETYVHPSSIGQHEITSSPIEAKAEEESVTLTRWMIDIEPPPFWATNLKSKERCDRWQICKFTLPVNVLIDVGVAPTGSGAPEGNREKGVTGIVINLMTPETETTTWYFWGMVRNFDIQDRGLSVRIREAQASVFAEDVEILEAQQASVVKHGENKLANMSVDVGGIYARRIIERVAKQQIPAG